MPPAKKAPAARLEVETLAYIDPHMRNSELEVWVRPGSDKIVCISPAYGLGPRHRLGYKRLMHDEIELMDGDQSYPIEKDFGMYWVEQHAEGWAVIQPGGAGEDHFILAMDKSVRDRRLDEQRRMSEVRNDNVTDRQHAAELTRGLKGGSSYESDSSDSEETMTF